MITVVIPVRDRAELVKRTLASIDAQTRRPEAVVLVDNGSTDGTMATLMAWAEGRDYVTVLSEPEPGAARARNTGLAAVRTPYVLFFDSDDEMPPRHIEQICEGLTRNAMPRIAAFDMTLVTLEGRSHLKKFRKGDPMEMHIFHAILSTQRFVVSTELINRAGGWNTNISAWDDWELGVRLLAMNPSVTYLPLDTPPVAYAQAVSITGTDFSSKAGRWEDALNAAEKALAGTRYARLIDYRRAILAGTYRREKHPELAKGLARGVKMKLIERYVAAGGRGVAVIARMLR